MQQAYYWKEVKVRREIEGGNVIILHLLPVNKETDLSLFVVFIVFQGIAPLRLQLLHKGRKST